MFEKFTPAARFAVILAQEEARELCHDRISPLHLVIALTRDDGIAGDVLRSLNIDTATLRNQAVIILGQHDVGPAGTIPFTHNSRLALELAFKLHLKLGHPHVGPEHILMALTTLDEIFLAWLYGTFRITETQLREAIARLMVTSAMSSGPNGPFTFHVQVDQHGAIHEGSAASNSRKAKFTLHPGELFSVSHNGTIDENARFLDYAAARDEAAEFYGDVVILTAQRKDIDALDRDGNRIKVGEATVWHPEAISNRLVFID